MRTSPKAHIPPASRRRGDLGPFGGNLDYSQIAEGATVYLPVFHASALLGMGDRHTAMGDGEVVGSGLETSMDVDFSAEVIPGDSSGMVRVENQDYLIALGVSGSVPVSIQIATSTGTPPAVYTRASCADALPQLAGHAAARLLPCDGAYAYRLPLEERALVRGLGPGYSEYMQRT